MRAIPLTVLSSYSSDAESYALTGSEPEFNIGTTYNSGDIVVHKHLSSPYRWGVWRSLQDSNSFKWPSSNPAWWELIYDLIYWDATKQFEVQTTDQVVWQDRTWKPIVQSINKQPDLEPTYWEDSGTYNPTRMWNYTDTSRTTKATSPLVLTATPGVATNSAAVFGIDATSVRLQASSTLGGGLIYDKTVYLEDTLGGNWFAQVYGSNRARDSFVVFDIPAFSDTVYTLTVSHSAEIKVGAVAFGTFVSLGGMEHGSESALAYYASVVRDLDPAVSPIETVLDIPSIRAQTKLLKADVRHADLLRKDILGQPAVWSGLDDYAAGETPLPLLMFGVYRRFQIALGSADATISLDLEALIAGGVVGPPVDDINEEPILLVHMEAFPLVNEVTGAAVTTTGGAPNMELVTGKFGNAIRKTSGYSSANSSHNFSPAAPLVAGGFTLEFWLAKPGGTGTPGAGNTWSATFYTQMDDASWATITITTYFDGGDSQYKAGVSVDNADDYFTNVGVGLLPDGDFHAYAFVVEGTAFRVYMDGVEIWASSFSVKDYTGRSIDHSTFVGISDSSNLGIKLDEVRLTPAALYTENYTPATTQFTYP